jgi:Uma2 family endonuclease
MGEPAFRSMEIEEFLRWEGEGDTRYQLRDGVPVAMAPPGTAHRVLLMNLGGRLLSALAVSRPGCTVQTEAGIPSPSGARNFHQADLAVSCTPQGPSDPIIASPILVVEVLSPTTADDDRRIKLPDYRAASSVDEIVLIDSRHIHCEVHRRQPDGRWVVDLLLGGEAVLRLDTVRLEARLDDLYRNVPLEAA